MSDSRAILGLDFGTTNSLLTYLDPERGLLLFEPTDEDERSSDVLGVRSAVGPRGNLAQRIMGEAALALSGVRLEFKLNLGAWNGKDDHAAYQAAKDFLEKLFFDFRQQRSSIVGIRKLVVTIPETWFTEKEQGGREAILRICEQLNLPRPELISEPVAAAAYFAHRYQETEKQPFEGYLLVYDHGGGTLDFSLCKVERGSIERVHGDGLSRISPRGFGGVAFDRQVFEHLKKKHSTLRNIGGVGLQKWLIDFERKKRGVALNIARICASERFQELKDQTIFSVDRVPVALSDLIDVFDRFFAPTILQQLEEFAAQCRRHAPDLDMTSPQHFRAIAVGGFSEFTPVQRLLDYFFASKSGSNVRDSTFGPDDRALAISMGACLAAAGAVDFNHTASFTFGVLTYAGGHTTERPLMTHGEPLAGYASTRFLEIPLGIRELDPKESPTVQFYIDRAGQKRRVSMRRPFSDTLPDYSPDQLWKFGAVVEDGLVHVVIRSRSNVEKRHRIGRFFDLNSAILKT